MHLSTLLFSSIIPVHISSYTRPSASSSIFHSPFYHALPTRSHIRSFSLSLSRSCPYRFRAPFSFSLPPYSFAKSQSTRQVTSMSATARFQAVEGNWLYSTARRSGQAFTHTPFAKITPWRGHREILSYAFKTQQNYN